MKFSVNSMILWPKKTEFTYRELPFYDNKINIITGASRTGKSSIIPIIDYCLGSTKCAIPVDTIRNACAWFGVIFNLDGEQLLLCRQEPGTQNSTSAMYMQRAPEVVIPNIVTANTNVDAVNRLLNELFSISALALDPSEKGFTGRPSYRDMMAFLFQPQNIVANADVLFYKADTSEHRQKLVNIFPYALGAVTPRILAARQEVDRLSKQRNRTQRELEIVKNVSDSWKQEVKSWLSQAREMGLTDFISREDTPFEEQVHQLSIISEKTEWDSSISASGISDISNELSALRKEEQCVSSQLFQEQKRHAEMVQLKDSLGQYDDSLRIMLQRLEISTWLRSLASETDECPLCHSVHSQSLETLTTFCNAIQKIEQSAGDEYVVPAAFERELQYVETQIAQLTEKLSSIRLRIAEESGKCEEHADRKYTLSSIARFLGKMETAVQTYDRLGKDEGLEHKLEDLNSRISELSKEINEHEIAKRINAALSYINLAAAKIVATLDVEHPDAPIEFIINDLTIRVQSTSGRKDYLWEIGSASNWLAYHIAVILAFQKYFQSVGKVAIPNFLVFDQPSQVYFPRLASKKKTEEDAQLDDEDKLAVRKIFNAMANFITTLGTDMQIIVTEHADESVWGGIEQVHLVEEWRGNNLKLVPIEWID